MLMVRGDVVPGPNWIRRAYRAGALNTFDCYGSHAWQHLKSDDEIRALVAQLQPDASRIGNLDRYFLRPQPIGIALPKLQTAANCNTAIEMLFDGIVKGTVDREAAKLLIDTVQTRLRVLEVTDLEARLAELERLAETHAPRDGRRS